MTDASPSSPTPPSPPPGGTGAAAPRPRRRWVAWALVASVCVNLLLIGAVGGAMLRHGPPGPPPPDGPGGSLSLHRIMRKLPDAQRDAARAIMEAHRPEFEALRPARAEARAAVRAALTAEPFDEAALEAAVQASRDASAASKAVIDRTFLEFVATLSAEDRAMLAEEMKKRRWRRRGPRGDKDGRGPRHDRHGPGDGPPPRRFDD